MTSYHQSKQEKMHAYQNQQTQRHDAQSIHILSRYKPVDYIRLLFWFVLQPQILKRYQRQIGLTNEKALNQQSGWLISTLLWWPFITWLAIPWATGAIPLAPITAVVLLTLLAFGWLMTGLGINRPKSAYITTITTALAAVIPMLVLTVAIPLETQQAATLLILGGISFLCTMIGVAIAAIMTLSTGETVAGVLAVVLLSGVVILMVDHMVGVFGMTVGIIGAILAAGILEERYENA